MNIEKKLCKGNLCNILLTNTSLIANWLCSQQVLEAVTWTSPGNLRHRPLVCVDIKGHLGYIPLYVVFCLLTFGFIWECVCIMILIKPAWFSEWIKRRDYVKNYASLHNGCFGLILTFLFLSDWNIHLLLLWCNQEKKTIYYFLFLTCLTVDSLVDSFNHCCGEITKSVFYRLVLVISITWFQPQLSEYHALDATLLLIQQGFSLIYGHLWLLINRYFDNPFDFRQL